MSVKKTAPNLYSRGFADKWNYIKAEFDRHASFLRDEPIDKLITNAFCLAERAVVGSYRGNSANFHWST